MNVFAKTAETVIRRNVKELKAVVRDEEDLTDTHRRKLKKIIKDLEEFADECRTLIQ